MAAQTDIGKVASTQSTEIREGARTALPEGSHADIRDSLGHLFSETSATTWGILLGCIFLGVVSGRAAQAILAGIGERLKKRGWVVRGAVFLDLARPVNLLLVTIGLSFGIAFLDLSKTADLAVFATKVIRFLYVLVLAWACYNLVDLIAILLASVTARTKSTLDDQIVPLVRKALRIFLVVVFTLFVAENVFGADITAWLAGLGIAGLAVSLAAQDSIKNLFGSLTIFMDHSFRVGDRVNFAGHEGTVEEIGFRSTKIRTLLGHLVTIPNAKIVDGTVENVARRPAIRRLLNVTVTYDTPPDKVERAVQIIRDILAEAEISAPFDMALRPPRVGFDEFNADSLNIRVFYWFGGNDYWAYLEHAQKFNLRLLRAFNEEQIEFAFPTRTLYLAGDARRELGVTVSAEGNGMRDE